MKNYKIYPLLLILFPQILSGCSGELDRIKNTVTAGSNINWQLSPEKPSERDLTDIKVSYLVPNSLANYESAENAIILERYNVRNATSSSREERLLIRNVSPNHLEIERRTDNGAAGSGRIFDIKITKTKTNNGTLVSFNAIKERTYQDGLILPFAIPVLDIKKYLTAGSIRYSMSVNSIYNPDSIQENFNRAFKGNNGYYHIETESSSVKADIQFHPYRNGTKVNVKATAYNIKFNKDIIDLNKVITDLKQKISDVTNE